MLCWVIDSEVDNVLLVEVVDIDECPDGLQNNGNNDEHACGHEFSSGGALVSGEEHHEEAACEHDWDVEDKDDHWVVPGEVVIQDQEEVV